MCKKAIPLDREYSIEPCTSMACLQALDISQSIHDFPAETSHHRQHVYQHFAVLELNPS